MKIKSFGCSFIFGTDLPDDDSQKEYPSASQLTWPALIAKNLGWDYRCYARGGSGNLQILHSVISQAAVIDQGFFVIGWTFQDRFDFVSRDEERWIEWETLRPTLDHQHAEKYFRDLHSQYRDKFDTLVCMQTAISILQQKKIPFLMTTVDDEPFDKQWFNTPAVSLLQRGVDPWMSWFENKNFLIWARDHGFPISKTMHPLTEAHAAAAQLMQPVIESRVTL